MKPRHATTKQTVIPFGMHQAAQDSRRHSFKASSKASSSVHLGAFFAVVFLVLLGSLRLFGEPMLSRGVSHRLLPSTKEDIVGKISKETCPDGRKKLSNNHRRNLLLPYYLLVERKGRSMKRAAIRCLSLALIARQTFFGGASEANYDTGLGFSPTGRLYQVEYASEAAQRYGSPTVCIRGRSACILAARRRDIDPGYYDADPSSPVSPRQATAYGAAASLVFLESVREVHRITSEVAFAASGVAGDGLLQAESLRRRALAFRRKYGHDPPASELALFLANKAQKATQTAETRPMATVAFVVGTEEPDPRDGRRAPVAYRIEPSGQLFLCARTSCAGQHSDVARAWLARALEKMRSGAEDEAGGSSADGKSDGVRDHNDDDNDDDDNDDDDDDDDGAGPDAMKKRELDVQPGPSSIAATFSMWGDPPSSYDRGIYATRDHQSTACGSGADADNDRMTKEDEEEDLVFLALSCLGRLPRREGWSADGGSIKELAGDAASLESNFQAVLVGEDATIRFVDGTEMAAAIREKVGCDHPTAR